VTTRTPTKHQRLRGANWPRNSTTAHLTGWSDRAYPRQVISLAESRDTVAARGFVLAKGCAADDLLPIANGFGSVSWDPRYPVQARCISPVPAPDAPPNTLTSRFGLGSFPFHTDSAHWRIPTRFLIMYCEHPGAGNRPTLLLDTHSAAWRDAVGGRMPNAVWSAALAHPFLCLARTPDGDAERWRYNAECMRPVSPSAMKEAPLIAHAVRSVPARAHHWSAGDLLILDNRRVLHARGEASTPDLDRRIVRLLIGGEP